MRITGPVLDCADPIGLARFYEQLLGWPIVEREGPRPGFPPDGDVSGGAVNAQPSVDMSNGVCTART